jgi:hypothetical protein
LDLSSTSSQSELTRRHKSVATTVVGLIIGTILLSVVAFLGRGYFRQQANATVEMAATIMMPILGIGAIVWRRTKFTTVQLQSIGALHGVSGLLSTLERTTLQIAFLGAAVAAIGFGVTLVTGDDSYTYRAAAISLVVLVYSYPTKSSWDRVIRQFAENPESSST